MCAFFLFLFCVSVFVLRLFQSQFHFLFLFSHFSVAIHLLFLFSRFSCTFVLRVCFCFSHFSVAFHLLFLFSHLSCTMFYNLSEKHYKFSVFLKSILISVFLFQTDVKIPGSCPTAVYKKQLSFRKASIFQPANHEVPCLRGLLFANDLLEVLLQVFARLQFSNRQIARFFLQEALHFPTRPARFSFKFSQPCVWRLLQHASAGVILFSGILPQAVGRLTFCDCSHNLAQSRF